MSDLIMDILSAYDWLFAKRTIAYTEFTRNFCDSLNEKLNSNVIKLIPKKKGYKQAYLVCQDYRLMLNKHNQNKDVNKALYNMYYYYNSLVLKKNYSINEALIKAIIDKKFLEVYYRNLMTITKKEMSFEQFVKSMNEKDFGSIIK
ncbi:hypothetical protein [Spiroplasma culicicola]|uniref:Uncharacterized protein n=1 Tax=Spiroplasma culicicola AES-1 TaxID=1276246 RepID=W6AFE6_9MOLU|nr:hypothetical protein [Spiroplasma culicicola]AHI52414.1 hypothetical protein SCULI_v1c00730 [Spiroplasma culicicola AES-1]